VLSRLAFGKSAGRLALLLCAQSAHVVGWRRFCRTLRGARPCRPCARRRGRRGLEEGALRRRDRGAVARHTEARLRDEGGIEREGRAHPALGAGPCARIDTAGTRALPRCGAGAAGVCVHLVLYAGRPRVRWRRRAGHRRLRAGCPPTRCSSWPAVPKTAAAKEAEQNLRARVTAAGMDARTVWLGETSRILDLLAAADVVALPSTNSTRRWTIPLVLLEAMASERSVIVANRTPAAELADGGGCPRGGTRCATPYAAGARGPVPRRPAKACGKRARAHVISPNTTPSAWRRRYEALYDASPIRRGIVPCTGEHRDRTRRAKPRLLRRLRGWYERTAAAATTASSTISRCRSSSPWPGARGPRGRVRHGAHLGAPRRWRTKPWASISRPACWRRPRSAA
jgi:hypothetical protein